MLTRGRAASSLDVALPPIHTHFQPQNTYFVSASSVKTLVLHFRDFAYMYSEWLWRTFGMFPIGD